MTNLKEARGKKYDNIAWGKVKDTPDAKAIYEWMQNLPEELKELGFKRIKKFRKDHTYIQAHFDIEAAYATPGPHTSAFFQKLVDEAIVVADKAFSYYLDDDLLNDWEKFSTDVKRDNLAHLIDKDDYQDALNRYTRRHPDELPTVEKFLKTCNSYNDDENPLTTARDLDYRNNSPAVVPIARASDVNRDIEFLFTLERDRNHTLYYNIHYKKIYWRGETIKELEEDWDDFLVNEFGNDLGA